MNPFLSSVVARIREASATLGLPAAVIELLIEPKRSIEVTFPVRLDSGETKAFKGWRIQHNDALGPYKGGVRFSPHVSREEVTALAATMSIKNAAHALPYGGAKGGVIIDPQQHSTREIEAVARGYVSALYNVIGPTVDVPAPDVNTNAMIIGWMMDEYSRIAGMAVPDSFTGKPVVLGGTTLREQATGLGGMFILEHAFGAYGWKKDIKETTVAIQGFGNVGATIAQLLDEAGFLVVAVSDSHGGIYDANGLNISEVRRAQIRAGTIKKNRCYPKSLHASAAQNVSCKEVSSEEFLLLDVDVLIPAAIENVITEKNAKKIKASIILEMANGAVVSAAEEILQKRGTIVVPDVIANGGGVATSYLEWVENRVGRTWNGHKVRDTLAELMKAAFEAAYTRSKETGESLRTASYAVAIGRIAEAMQARGWISA